MKKPRASRSAYASFRVFLAFTLCLAGLSLAVTAYGAWPALTAATWVASQKQAALDAKANAQNRKRAAALKNIAVRSSAAKSSVGGAPAPANPAAQMPFDPSALSTVKQHTNGLGQTVYVISPSQFDVSPPLSELAQLSIPEPPAQQFQEPELPAWRIPRSDRPDPVTQVAPAPRDYVSRPGAPAAPAAATTGFNFEGINGAGSFPPDNNGSVGNNQYVETVNSRYQVWSLNRALNTATSVAGPANINTLWAGFRRARVPDPECRRSNRALRQTGGSLDDFAVYFGRGGRCLLSVRRGLDQRERRGNLCPLRVCRARRQRSQRRRLRRLSALRRLDRCLLCDGAQF